MEVKKNKVSSNRMNSAGSVTSEDYQYNSILFENVCAKETYRES